MSAIPHIRQDVIIERSPLARPAYRVVRAKPKTNVAWRDLARFGFWLFSFVVVFHLVFGFVAQLKIEQVRVSSIDARSTSAAAITQTAELRQQLEKLKAADRIESWAALNGFESSYLASHEEPH